nr:unnamed protein product [Digitaria exilis]
MTTAASRPTRPERSCACVHAEEERKLGAGHHGVAVVTVGLWDMADGDLASVWSLLAAASDGGHAASCFEAEAAGESTCRDCCAEEERELALGSGNAAYRPPCVRSSPPPAPVPPPPSTPHIPMGQMDFNHIHPIHM